MKTFHIEKNTDKHARGHIKAVRRKFQRKSREGVKKRRTRKGNHIKKNGENACFYNAF